MCLVRFFAAETGDFIFALINIWHATAHQLTPNSGQLAIEHAGSRGESGGVLLPALSNSGDGSCVTSKECLRVIWKQVTQMMCK